MDTHIDFHTFKNKIFMFQKPVKEILMTKEYLESGSSEGVKVIEGNNYILTEFYKGKIYFSAPIIIDDSVKYYEVIYL
jgi:hypothetical protein